MSVFGQEKSFWTNFQNEAKGVKLEEKAFSQKFEFLFYYTLAYATTAASSSSHNG